MSRRIQLFLLLIVLSGVVMAATLPLVLSPVPKTPTDTTTPLVNDPGSPDNVVAPTRDADERNLPIPINYYNTCCASDEPSWVIRFGNWEYPLSLPRPHEFTLAAGNFELPDTTQTSNIKKPKIFQFAQPDSYVIGGPPIGGLTYGWGLPETYAGNTTRQVLLQKTAHTAGAYTDCDQTYATDISVENAPLDFVPVYSTLQGTVVEFLGSDPQVEASCPDGVTNCDGYGNFVRTRNSKWAAVNAVDLYKDNNTCARANRFEPGYPNQEVPAHALDKESCKSDGKLTDDPCPMDCIRDRDVTCDMTPKIEITIDPILGRISKTTYPDECNPCRNGRQYGKGPLQGCNNSTGTCYSYYCVSETSNPKIAGGEAYRMIVNDMDKSIFRNKRLGEPPYGYYRDVGDNGSPDVTGVARYVDIALVHVTNWEVVQSYMTDGSVDKFISGRDVTLRNDSQIGTLGNSGYYGVGRKYFLNSKRPMMHYEIWNFGFGAYDPPDTLMQPWPYNLDGQPQVTIGNANDPPIPTIYNQFALPDVCKDDQLTMNVEANIDTGYIGTAVCEHLTPSGTVSTDEFKVYAYNALRSAWTSPGGQPKVYVYKPFDYPGMNPQLYWKIDHTVGTAEALLSITMGDPLKYYPSHRQYLTAKVTGPFLESAGPLDVTQMPVYFNFDVANNGGTPCSVVMTDYNAGPETYTTDPIDQQPVKCVGRARVDEHPDQHKLKSGYIDCACNPNGGDVCSDPTPDPNDPEALPRCDPMVCP